MLDGISKFATGLQLTEGSSAIKSDLGWQWQKNFQLSKAQLSKTYWTELLQMWKYFSA